MLAEFGRLCLWLATTVLVAHVALGWTTAVQRERDQEALTRRLAVCAGVLLLLAFGALCLLFVRADFSVALVADHAHHRLPLLYRIAAVWGNHEGSLLLWLTLYGVVLLIVAAGGASTLVRCWLAGITALFALVVLLTSDPFVRISPPPPTGADLNPLLQHPALMIHPPILYAGYTVLTWAAILLLVRCVDPNQVSFRSVRVGLLLSWSLLTAGLSLGSWWAYSELGWGGFWFWDPVENVALVPWLLNGALCHWRYSTLPLRDPRTPPIGMAALGLWAVLSALMGTALVRSGLLVSVHTFAADPARGVAWIGVFTTVVVVVTSVLWRVHRAWRSSCLVESRLESERGSMPWWSRPALVSLALLLWGTSAATVTMGIVYPLILAGLGQPRVTVGMPFFVASVMPLWFIACGLMSLAFASVGSRRAWIMMGGLILMGLMIVLATSRSSTPLDWWGYALGGAGVSIMMIGGLIASLRRHQHLRISDLSHGGLMFVVLGIVLHATLTVEFEQRIEIGQSISLPRGIFEGPDLLVPSVATVEVVSFDRVVSSGSALWNYRAQVAQVVLHGRERQVIATLFPERRTYVASGIRTTEAAVVGDWLVDHYVVVGDLESDGTILVRYRRAGGMRFLWLGAGTIVLALLAIACREAWPLVSCSLASLRLSGRRHGER